MEWRVVKAQLIAAAGFDLEIKGGFGQSKTIQLAMADGSPNMLRFKTLGSGSMKRVVRVENTEWVLALAGDSQAAEKDMTDEVKTLIALSDDGVRVPEPFVGGKVAEILFNLKIFNSDLGDEKTYPAFLQQFLQGQEMEKLKNRAEFAKDHILVNGAAPATIKTTIEDLEKILKSLRKKEWGDFQVIYQKGTGYTYVFDPLPDNKSGVSAIPIVEAWLADIAKAK